MSDKTDTIDKVNLNLTFGELEQRVTLAAKEVTEAFRIRDKAIAKKEAIDKEITADYEGLAEERKDLLLEQTSMEAERVKYRKEVKLVTDRLKTLYKSEKERLKRLDRLNAYIFDAEDSKKVLDKEIYTLRQKSVQKGTLDDQVAALKHKIEGLEAEKVVIVRSISDKQKEYSLKLKGFQETLDEMETIYKNIDAATTESENRKIEFDSEYNRKLRDIDVLTKRLGKKWKKLHPNLKMRI